MAAIRERRVYKVSEVGEIPSRLTDAERREQSQIVDEVLRAHEAFLAAGGKPMSQEEFEEYWDSIRYGDEDDECQET